jgi:hypothetical protein
MATHLGGVCCQQTHCWSTKRLLPLAIGFTTLILWKFSDSEVSHLLTSQGLSVISKWHLWWLGEQMVLLYKSIQLIWRGAVFALCIQFRIAQCPLAVPAIFPSALIWLQIYDIINAIRKICWAEWFHLYTTVQFISREIWYLIVSSNSTFFLWS